MLCHQPLLSAGSSTLLDSESYVATLPCSQTLLVSIPPSLPTASGVLPPFSNYRHTTPAIASEYGASSASKHLSYRQTAKKVGRNLDRGSNRMMPSNRSASSSSSLSPVQFTVPAYAGSKSAFTFAALPCPTMALTFPPRPTHLPQKRYRAVTDVDGERSCLRKKKRRLRLFLITSRLSLPFSQPATNIVDRGNSKIAVWAKQKALGRNLLRKAAILNRIKRHCLHIKDIEQGGYGRTLLDQEEEQRQFELAKLEFIYGSHDTHTRPVLRSSPTVPSTPTVRAKREDMKVSKSPVQVKPVPGTPPTSSNEQNHEKPSTQRSPNDAYFYPQPGAQIPRKNYLPLPPSPLGLSNYDALDLEDEIPDRYADLDDDSDSPLEPDYDEDMPDVNITSPPSFAATLPTAGTGTIDSTASAKTPPKTIYSDFNILDPGDAVVGDYDGVDGVEGCEPVWPSIVLLESPEAKTILPLHVLGETVEKEEGGDVFSTTAAASTSLPPTSCSPNFAPLDAVGVVIGTGMQLRGSGAAAATAGGSGSAVGTGAGWPWPPQRNTWPSQAPPLPYSQHPLPPAMFFRRDSFPPNALFADGGNVGFNVGLDLPRKAEEGRDERAPRRGVVLAAERGGDL